VLIIAATIAVSKIFSQNIAVKKVADFLGEPNIAMIETIIIATYTLGIYQGKKLADVMKTYTDSVKDIAMILLIIGGSGIFKQILIDSGASNQIAAILKDVDLPPLFLAWLITAIFRLSLGSATVAGLTAAGILYPLTLHTSIDPSLLVLAIGAGSMFCSHVNDTAFWLFKEYFGLSMKDTFMSWSLMETSVSVMGLIGVLGLSLLHL
jgi:Gnt-I system high-affinity gluconate transporter